MREPPRLGSWLLHRVATPRYRDLVEADIAELYEERLRVRGALRAAFWYYADVVSLVGTRYARWNHSRHSQGEPLRAAVREGFMTVMQDLRQAVRSLRKSPAYTSVVVITLALAIGANSAIFSVVDGVLLRPLPYDEPGAIAVVREIGPEETGAREQANASQTLFLQWRDSGSAFEELAMYSNEAATVTSLDEPARLNGIAASPALFPLLRVDALHGRTFASDEELDGNDGVILLGHRTWQRYFGGDRDLVGTSISLDERPRIVVGIMPPGFAFPDESIEYWVPMLSSIPEPGDDPAAAAANRSGARVREERVERRTTSDGGGPGGDPGAAGGGEDVHSIELWGRLVGRLADGVSPAMASDEGTTLVRGLREADADERGVEVIPFQEQLVGSVRQSLLLLMGAVGFVLLIACANVANLVLARSVERRKETAVRAAIGAAWGRLVRLLFVESVVLSLVGGVLGLGLAYGGVRVLGALGPDFIPRLDAVAVDGRVVAFTLAVSLLTAILFSLAPARGALGLDLTRALKEEFGRSSGAVGLGRDAFRKLLVTVEVALSVVLLVGASLLVTSFIRLTSVDPGYNPENLLVLNIQLPPTVYADAAAHLDFYDTMVERLESLPGVQSATVTNQLPSLPANIRVGIARREGPEPPSPEQRPTPVGVRMVENGYFEAVGANLRDGRVFNEMDRVETEPVAVLSESGAAALFGENDPVDEMLDFMGGQRLRILGVVADVRTAGVDPTPQPDIFLPYRQAPGQMVPMLFRTANVMVRTGPAPLSVLPAIRTQIRQLDGSVPILSAATMRDQLAESVAEPRFYASLVAAFAAVALTLAAVGIYGLLAYSVQQRVQETAIRRALGAQATQVLRSILVQGLALAAVGLAIGMAAALAVTRLLESMLYEIEPTEPSALAAVAVVFFVVALLAVFVPARRAVRIDPMDALRYE